MAIDYYNADPETVAAGVIRYWTDESEEFWDAVDCFIACEQSEPKIAWDIAMAITRQTGEKDHLGSLGAGALETMLRVHPDWTINKVREELPKNPRLGAALELVRLDATNPVFKEFLALVRRFGFRPSEFCEAVEKGEA